MKPRRMFSTTRIIRATVHSVKPLHFTRSQRIINFRAYTTDSEASKNEEKLPAHCPYSPGTRLSLDFTGDLNAGHHTTATIISPFLPFTQSQALTVSLSLSPPHPSLPHHLVLKLFDRRFLDRGALDRPWTPLADAPFRKVVEECQKEGRALPDFDWWRDDEDPDEGEDWMHECVAENRMISNFRVERRAYLRLKALQGVSIPRYFGAFRCRVEGAEPDSLSDIAGVALEFIDGVPLDEYKTTYKPSLEEGERLAQAALGIMRKLRHCQVLHTDIRCGNLLVRKSDLSPTPVLIDFSLAKFREDYETDDKWLADVKMYQEIQEMRRLLEYKELYEATPMPIEENPYGGYRCLNFIASSPMKSKEWRERYWEEIKVEGPEKEKRMVRGEDGKEVEVDYEFARYRLREGMRTTEGDMW